MAKHYRIHPAIGVARVGNCPAEFYLAPETIGGLPLTCNADGEQPSESSEKYVRQFKDKEGRIKRQAARFRLLEYDSDAPDVPGREVRAGQNGIADVQWTVHIANKKPAWWNFSEQAGDLAWGEWNSYENQEKNPKLAGTPWAVAKRNAKTKGTDDRRKLIIDPGPRTVSPGSPRARFDRQTDYECTFPPSNLVPTDISTLGELMVDSQGRLLVLGGYGHAGGPSFNITSFGGADGWYDDVSDGPVYASVQLEDGTTVEAETAWVIVGSPKFAPELVNIVTLDDLIYDGAIREMKFNPDIYDPKAFPDGGWNRSYRPNFDRDIKPILDRPAAYRWVSNIPFMNSFAPPPFDARDGSEANRRNREKYLSYFRTPVEPKEYPNEEAASAALAIPNGPAFAFGDGGGGAVAEQVPLMPLNSGSNPLNPVLIIKFLTLTPTQYFFLQQWAAGLFDVTPNAGPAEKSVPAEDRISAGNCVGGPLCPGIETTWIMQNKQIYHSPYRIKPAHPESYYAKHGLDPDRDEGRGGGCEPGDLTKRMAIPWQSDFFDCSTQYVNFTDSSVNKDSTGTPVPPTFFVYWWPPQSPEFTMPNAMTPETQLISGLSVGMQAPYSRGINSFGQMILAWSYLPFIADQNRGDAYQNPGDPRYGYFTEQERSDDMFSVGVVGLGDVSVMGGNYSVNPAGTYVPFWYLLKDLYNYKK